MNEAEQPGATILRLLDAHRGGDPNALDQVFELVYGELRKLAHFQRRGIASGATLNTTGLVHEAYLKVANAERPFAGHDRAHFFNIAAQAMRQILVDAARSRMAKKRGDGQKPVSLEGNDRAVEKEAESLIDLDNALSQLARERPRAARVFECRYFAGLDTAETASAVEVSHRTAERDWNEARTWLKQRLAHG